MAKIRSTVKLLHYNTNQPLCVTNTFDSLPFVSAYYFKEQAETQFVEMFYLFVYTLTFILVTLNLRNKASIIHSYKKRSLPATSYTSSHRATVKTILLASNKLSGDICLPYHPLHFCFPPFHSLRFHPCSLHKS